MSRPDLIPSTLVRFPPEIASIIFGFICSNLLGWKYHQLFLWPYLEDDTKSDDRQV
ncbi:hypothetical protein CPB84DRAFT_1794584 [Gymnopilus junonius]|uniref:Uncharacterized protein n=1 Tax=Gymnopilus junonius TaxID=109634 RepID=A0A9P5TGF1_GYMJU|nr:hypothetical protein CPB84DRAFT_1794584 [Gymnopilus junonius]